MNARNYRESYSKLCQTYDMGQAESVEHVMLECKGHERDRKEIMQLEDERM